MRILKYTFIFFLLNLTFSCKKDNSPSLLLIEPDDIEIKMKSGDVQSFKITCSSNTILESLKIISKEEDSFSITILDSTLSQNKFIMTYEYQAPSVINTTSELLTFILTDADGNQTSIPRYIKVSPKDIVLKETTGNVMYSHLSGKFDAFNLQTVEPIYSSQLNYKLIHIKDNSVDSVNHNTLSRQWISTAGLKFVLFNGFDYANASYSLVRNSYEAGMKVSIIKDIKEEDIILTKLVNSEPDSGYIAIKMVYVIDSDSTLNDRYIFNVKK